MGGVNKPRSILDRLKDVERLTGLLARKANSATLASTTDDVVLETPAAVRLKGGAGTYIDHETTATAANAVITSGGLIRRSTSSRRYKRDISDAEIDPDQALALVPRRFISTIDGKEHVGFIAEEAADLGLFEWVTYDDYGPEEFSYAGWAVALQAVCRAQQEQIDELTRKVKSLTGPFEGFTIFEGEGNTDD